jgi:hypothetical protein
MRLNVILLSTATDRRASLHWSPIPTHTHPCPLRRSPFHRHRRAASLRPLHSSSTDTWYRVRHLHLLP